MPMMKMLAAENFRQYLSISLLLRSTVIDQLDHQLINDIKGLENPTAENITIWIWQQIKPLLPLLSRIELYETPTTGVIYKGS